MLAGGKTLLPTMKQRLAAPAALVDLAQGRRARRHRARRRQPRHRRHDPARRRRGEPASSATRSRRSATLAGLIGDPAVRHRGTIGGSLANNDPAADYPAAALALGATIVTNKREIAADDFFKGLFETALEDERDHHAR